MSRTTRAWISLSAVLLLGLGGCTTGITEDPIDRPGTWRATGVNDQNLQAMIATPSHLERGVGATTDRGQAGSLAVTRLCADQRRRLPVVNASRVTGTQQEGADPPVTGPGTCHTGGGGGGASR